MFKIMIIIGLVSAFLVDTSIKAVCNYNDKLNTKQSIIEDKVGRNSPINMSIKFEELIDCSNVDKPFVYSKQINELKELGERFLASSEKQGLIEIKEFDHEKLLKSLE